MDGDPDDAAQPNETNQAVPATSEMPAQPIEAAEQVALAAVAVATVAAEPKAPPPALVKAQVRRLRWRNPEFDDERQEMRRELDAMLAEARDPFADGAADAERMKRSRRGIVQACELAGLAPRGQELAEDGDD
jgi:hypothetical protein